MRPRKRVKRWLVYVAVRSIAAVLGVLPVRWALGIGAFFGLAAYFIDRSDRARAIAQIASSLGIPRPAARAVARRVFANVGRVAAEIAILPRLDLSTYVEFPSSSLEAVSSALSLGRGAMFISAHLGSWELLAQRIAHEGFDAATFAKKSSNPWLGDWLVARRAIGRLETINRGDRRAPRQMIAALKRGAILGALIDQDTRVDSVHVPFFGTPAATPIAPAELAIRSKLPVLVGFISRKPGGVGHTISIERVELPADAREATALLTAKIEAAIRRSPSEWVWFHARWKTPPAD